MVRRLGVKGVIQSNTATSLTGTFALDNTVSQYQFYAVFSGALTLEPGEPDLPAGALAGLSVELGGVRYQVLRNTARTAWVQLPIVPRQLPATGPAPLTALFLTGLSQPRDAAVLGDSLWSLGDGVSRFKGGKWTRETLASTGALVGQGFATDDGQGHLFDPLASYPTGAVGGYMLLFPDGSTAQVLSLAGTEVIYRFSGFSSGQRFTTYRLFDTTAGLPDDLVRAAAVDGASDLWLFGPGGLSRRGAAGAWSTVSASAPQQGHTHLAWSAARGALVATSTGGFFFLDPATLAVQGFTLASQGGPTGLGETADGTLWFTGIPTQESGSGGLTRVSLGGVFQTFLPDSSGLPSAQLVGLAIGPEGDKWMVDGLSNLSRYRGH